MPWSIKITLTKVFLSAARLSEVADGRRVWIKLNFISENHYTLFNTPVLFAYKTLNLNKKSLNSFIIIRVSGVRVPPPLPTFFLKF